MVVAVHSYNLFGNVGIGEYVVAVAGESEQKFAAVFLHAEIQPFKYLRHVFYGNLYAEERVELFGAYRHFLNFGIGVGRFNVAAHVGNSSAAERVYEVERTLHCAFRGVFVRTLFKYRRGIGVLSERARSLSHAVARKFCCLEQYFFRRIFDFGVESAHYARERCGLVAVAYHEVFVV